MKTIFLVAALFSSTAFATKPVISVYEGLPCRTVLEHRRDGSVRAQLHQYARGYISAYNTYNAQRIYPDLSEKMVVDYVVKHCRKNPGYGTLNAIRSMAIELGAADLPRTKEP
ncbi:MULTISPECIES: hypothetical protein [unclassified Variovorax]|jgi:hypothetical protein|uniref:hypothetical protein n=1 Tax=unclassified Variovorax TaxID=663243 RepID=UPI000F7F93AA|nr:MULTISPECIES: hypothetical protein [unclassified Variovorax]RSZ32776.1 hypothetical protein EJO70_29955 [Variovorax sp. 553]RSZ32988.1 hypothetical protein EJO71_29130 [Variovorax sp. 679]